MGGLGVSLASALSLGDEADPLFFEHFEGVLDAYAALNAKRSPCTNPLRGREDLYGGVLVKAKSSTCTDRCGVYTRENPGRRSNDRGIAGGRFVSA